MIFGNCPHCEEPITFTIPDGMRLPVLEKYTCEHCGKWFWEKLTRIDPQAYLPEEVEVDEKAKTVKIIGESE